MSRLMLRAAASRRRARGLRPAGPRAPDDIVVGAFSDGYDDIGYEGNEGFNPSSPTLKDGTALTGAALDQWTAGAYWALNASATTDPWMYVNPLWTMTQADQYQTSRAGMLCVVPILTLFRYTGDLRLLDRLVDTFDAFVGHSSWVVAWEANVGITTDWSGYVGTPKWAPHGKKLYRGGGGDVANLNGTDLNVLNTVKEFAMLAEFAWVLWVNRNKASPGGKNYAASFATYRAVVEAHANAWGMEPAQSNHWTSNYKAVDGSSGTTGFGVIPNTGSSGRRNAPGVYPIILRNESHTAIDSAYLHYYLALLGLHAGANVGNPADCLSVCDLMVTQMRASFAVTCTTPQGPGLLQRRGRWFSGEGVSGDEAMYLTYSGMAAWRLLGMYLIGRWRSVFTSDDLMKQARVVNANMDNVGQMNLSLGQGVTDHSLTKYSTARDTNTTNVSRNGHTVLVAFEEEDSDELYDKTHWVQVNRAGGYSTPTSGLPAISMLGRYVVRHAATPLPDDAYLSDPYYNPVVAFRGAMGYGANATGGRGNGTPGNTTLYFVDNLNDSGTGSLRAALTATGKRVIVPRVGGWVNLQTRISVNNPDGHQNFTFLGQLAPGDGLAVRHASLPAADNFTPIVWRANNAIVRHLRIRAGQGTNIDALGLWGEATNGSSDMIFDHISASWATDESVQFWSGLSRITIQNSLIGEALDWSSHPLGILLGPYTVTQTSLLYNLLMTGKTRYPYYKNGPLNQYIGNVVYNSRDDFMFYVGEEASLPAHAPSLDCINNTWLNGPLTSFVSKTLRIRNQGAVSGLRGSLYLRGNYAREITDEADLDNQWDMAQIVDSAMTGTLAEWRRDTEHGTPAIHLRSRSAAVAYVLGNAGANRPRDSVDARHVTQVINNTGPSDYPLTVAAAGGYPTITGGTYPTAADGVISDAWRAARGESRNWYELDTGGTGRMILENYADDVADGLWIEP